MFKLLKKNNKILRTKTPKTEISPKIKKIIKEMREFVDLREDGVALAAPQVGKSLRIFVVSQKVFFEPELKNFVYINPKIIRESKKREWLTEGCLSVPSYVGEVNRAVKCAIKAYDENGKIFTRGASGLLSQIFQHETDHLDGILFTDKARNLKKIVSPKNNYEKRN